VVEVLQRAGVQVLAAGSIIDRSGGRADIGRPRARWSRSTWSATPRRLPVVRPGQPVVKPGSRPT